MQDALIVALVRAGPPAGAMRAQCSPRRLEAVVGDRLPLAFRLHPVSHSHVLDIIEADGQVLHCRPLPPPPPPHPPPPSPSAWPGIGPSGGVCVSLY